MNHRARRLLGPALLTSAVLAATAAPVILAAPAQAEPPPHDQIAGATVVTTAPATWTFDTSEATADRSDGRCVEDRSVWFRLTPEFGQVLEMTTAGSTFDTRLALFRGPRDARRLIDCDNNDGPGKTSAGSERIKAGQRYWIAVSSSTPGVGGAAVLRIGRTGPPEIDVVDDEVRSGAVSGRMIVDATVTCGTTMDLRLSARVSQRVGDVVAAGSGTSQARLCDGSVSTSIRVDTETGYAFSPGQAALTLRSWGWDGISRVRASTTEIVTVVDDPAARP